MVKHGLPKARSRVRFPSSAPNQDYTFIQCVVFCFGGEGAIEAPGAAKAGQPLCDSHEIKKMLKNGTSLS